MFADFIAIGELRIVLNLISFLSLLLFLLLLFGLTQHSVNVDLLCIKHCIQLAIEAGQRNLLLCLLRFAIFFEQFL
jgi:hypothetical protein